MWRTLLVLLVLLLAGCLGGPPEPARLSGTEPSPSASDARDSLRIPDATRSENATNPGSVGTVVINFTVKTSLMAADVILYSSDDALYPWPSVNTTGYVFEVEWEPELTTDQLHIVLYKRKPTTLGYERVPVADAAGRSPLRLSADGEKLDHGKVHDLAVEPVPGTVGAIVDQTVTVHITEFRNRPFDAGYSDLKGTPG